MHHQGLPAAAMAAVAGLVLTAGALPAASAAAHHRSAVRLSPYLDVSLPGRYAVVKQAIRQEHLNSVSAGFAIASPNRPCTPTWDDGVAVRSDRSVNSFLSSLRKRGVAVVPSFGGEDGSELATVCNQTGKLTAAYRSVIRRTHAGRIDFDIEGAAIGDRASFARRFAAINRLRRHDHGLTVSLTIPVTPSGLDSNGVALLRAARRSGVRIAVVNIMTMDYGSPEPSMGGAAIKAAKHALAQVRRNYDRAATWSTIGITPMIGQNDTRSEVFGLGDARRLAGFADRHHLGEVAFWSLDRDQQCGAPSTSARSDCSGVSQPRFDFTRIFSG